MTLEEAQEFLNNWEKHTAEFPESAMVNNVHGYFRDLVEASQVVSKHQQIENDWNILENMKGYCKECHEKARIGHFKPGYYAAILDAQYLVENQETIDVSSSESKD